MAAHHISPFQSYRRSLSGRHTAWNPSLCRGPEDALTELLVQDPHK